MTQPSLDTEAPIRPLAARGLGVGHETVGELLRPHTRAPLRRGLRHAARRATTTAIRKATNRL